MYPGRFWAALGTGEASNEHITGDRWPRKEVRNARLRECVDVIRALLAGEEVSHDGLVTVDRARLWTLPDAAAAADRRGGQRRRPRGWAAGWADGLITVEPAARARCAQMVDAYRDAGGRGPLAPAGPPVLGAATRTRRCAIAHDQWRTNVFAPPAVLGPRLRRDSSTSAAKHVPPEADARGRARLRRPRPARGVARTSSSSSASTSCTCTTSARSSADVPSSASAPRSLPAARRHREARDEDHRHQRPVVEDRRRLLPRRRDLPRLERRRHRRPRRASRSASTTSPSSASPACG